MVNLRQDPDLIEDLIGRLGVADLGALDGHQRAVVEDALVHLAVAADAEEVVTGEVGSGALDLSAGEVLGRAATGVVLVEYLLPLLGNPLPRLADAALPAVEEEAAGADQRRRAYSCYETCSNCFVNVN